MSEPLKRCPDCTHTDFECIQVNSLKDKLIELKKAIDEYAPRAAPQKKVLTKSHMRMLIDTIFKEVEQNLSR